MTAPVLFRERHNFTLHLMAWRDPHARVLWSTCSGMRCTGTLLPLRESRLNSRHHCRGRETPSVPPQPVGLKGSS
jgi:hypothetical protein